MIASTSSPETAARAADGPLPVVTPRRVFQIQLACIGVLLLLHLAQVVFVWLTGGQVLGRVAALFDVDREQNLPTVYSALALWVAGALCAVVGSRLRRTGERWAWHWLGLAGLFAFLGLDEFCMIHELFKAPLKGLASAAGGVIPPWAFMAGPAVLVVALIFLRWLLALPATVRWLGVLAGGAFVGGAIGFETLGGLVPKAAGGERTVLYHALATVEEGLEMLGVALWITAVLTYAVGRFGGRFEVGVVVREGGALQGG